MKKYLMTGIAALALGAGFTSCSHDIEPMTQEEINQIEAQKIVQTYEQAFIKTFGQPAANQNWGFGAANLRTRAISDMEAGSNKNRNQWAATDGKFKLIVPTPLTEGQKLRVQKYFQTHANLTWIAPDMTNYFIQQVYKGNPETAGTLSAEQYPTGNGKTVKSSDHMDQLTVGDNNVHVLDFNNGNNPNTAEDVKNNGTLTNDNAYHSDQITLMIGVQPTCVGFQSSDGSVKHNDCMALAGAKVIDDWARGLDTPIGEDVWYGTDQYGYENKSWNRSFVGLDYEQQTLAQCSTDRNVKISDFQKDWVWDGTKLWRKNEYINTNGEDFIYNNKVVKYVTANTNEICATNVDESQQTWYLTRMDASKNGGNSSEEVIDLTKVNAKLATNCYPVENGGLQKWVKNIGGRDYVYSDWIVTLTPAKEYTNSTGGGDNPGGGTTDQTSNADLRIIAEDLTASDENDFDFNDVVFDVYFGGANEAKIVVQAAGGTLPLRIKIGNGEYQEVHAIWDKNTSMMINTYAEKKYPGRGVSDLGPSDPIILKYAVADAEAARDNITIEVQKTVNNQTQWIELKAEQGKAPAKIAVDPDWQWREERESIKDVTGFTNYVTNGGEWEGMRRQ